MRVCSVKTVVLLLACLTICYILYLKPSDRQRPAGGDVASPAEHRVAHREERRVFPEEETVEAPCSLRTAVRNDVALRGKFRFSVPVLQWAGSFSDSDWERLKNQAPPYGWKGLLPQAVRSVLALNSSRLFNRDSPDRCVRCAVVGNGGILRGSGQGSEIDGHDLVFRMNGAVTRGFEEDVGTKMSFYGFTTNTMKNALLLYRDDGFTRVPQSPEVRYIFIPSDVRDYVMMAAAMEGQVVDSGRDQGDEPWEYFGHKPPEDFKILHPDFISYVTDSFLSSHLRRNIRTRHLYMPSTGALMLLVALHTCDQVSAYGFITRNYVLFSDHYYGSRRRPLRFYSNHDLRMESELWESLHRRDVIRLYQREGGS